MIIGITGTDGAGKGAVVEYLVREKGFTHFSARSFIVTEIEKRNLPVNRENMRLVANDMRRELGGSIIVDRSLAAMEKEGIENAVIESIRSLGEAERLKERGGVLFAVDADQHVRYERIHQRASASDNVTFEEFVRHEALEMNDPDPNGMQKAQVMAMADHTIMNDGTVAELHQKIDGVLKTLAN